MKIQISEEKPITHTILPSSFNLKFNIWNCMMSVTVTGVIPLNTDKLSSVNFYVPGMSKHVDSRRIGGKAIGYVFVWWVK